MALTHLYGCINFKIDGQPYTVRLSGRVGALRIFAQSTIANGTYPQLSLNLLPIHVIRMHKFTQVSLHSLYPYSDGFSNG